MKKMILFSNGNQHDINHFLKVHAYAAAIGACEGLPEDTLQTLELAAIVHDIACPCAAKNMELPTANIRSLKVRRSRGSFLPVPTFPPISSSALSGWSRTTTRFARLRARTIKF